MFSLPDHLREVVEAVVAENMCIRRAARRLGYAHATTYERYARGLKSLRERLRGNPFVLDYLSEHGFKV